MTKLFSIAEFLLAVIALWEIRIVTGCGLMLMPGQNVRVPVGGSGDVSCIVSDCGPIPIKPSWLIPSGSSNRLDWDYVTEQEAVLFYRNVTKEDFREYWCYAWVRGDTVQASMTLSEEPGKFMVR